MEPGTEHKNQKPRNGAFRKWMGRFGVLIGIVLITFAAGYFSFLATINSYQAVEPDAVEADGIVVLTGGFARLSPAVELLKQKRAERLLVSGVNRATSDKLLQNVLEVGDTLYDCCIDIDQDALDTIGNAVGTAHWATSKDYKSLIVVTNDYHMPRSLMELQRTMDDIILLPYPVRTKHKNGISLSERVDRYRVLLGEYGKYLASKVRGFGTGEKMTANSAYAGLSTGW